MRPKSILLFEKLFLGNMAASVLAVVFNYGLLRADAIACGKSAAGPLLGIVLTLIVDLLFWYFVSRRASSVAKWLLVAFYGFGFLGMVPALSRIVAYGLSYAALTALSSVLSLAAIAMLFTREAREWFARRGAPSPTDPSIFE